jgi:hypothetical protein
MYDRPCPSILYIRYSYRIGTGLRIMLGCELPRIPIPRTPVNKGKKEGWQPVTVGTLSVVTFENVVQRKFNFREFIFHALG